MGIEAEPLELRVEAEEMFVGWAGEQQKVGKSEKCR